MSDSSPNSIGSFRILSKLGQGGMGTVYRAVQGTLERPVALKVLPPEFSSHPEYVARFLREARTIAAIRHENIVQVYDSGEFSSHYYIAMELIDGGNLLNIADSRKKIEEQEGLRMMLQAAKGLNAAHAKGLIHRDIKPENLLMGTDGVLRIVDFGLVMDSGSATQLTLAGTCLGTPMYMSPEQADGEVADPRSDLYALGATFFRVFTGRPPFGSATVMNILYKQKFEQPPDPQALRPDLSRGAADLILHLLAKRRDDRPEGATTLIAMIEDVLAGKPIPAPPPFAPLIPKPRQQDENDESRETAAGDTRALFGSKPARQGESGSAGKFALTAAVFAAVAGVVALLLYAPEKSLPLEKPVAAKPVPPMSDAELRERIAMGEKEFNAGRLNEARAIFKEALRLAPRNFELIRWRDRTDRGLNFEVEMQAARELEKQGKLNDALYRFQNAQALDEGASSQACIDRVSAAIEAAKKPVAVFSPAVPRSEKELKMEEQKAELERTEKLADEAQRLGAYEKAESAYLHAAALTDGKRSTDLAEKGRLCRRLIFIAEARDAEAIKDFKRAEAAYLNAQKIVNDPATSALLSAVQQKMLDEEKAEARYRDVMREGEDALEKGDFVQARVKFGVAMELKPGFSPPVSKLNEVEAREFLSKGDAARDAGDLTAAQKCYESAIAKCSAMETEAQARIASLAKAQSRSDRSISKACQLAAEHRDAEALAVLDDAIKLDPDVALLKDAKVALETVRAAEDVIEKTQRIQAAAMERFRIGAELDEDDAATKRHALNISKQQLALIEKSHKPEIAISAGNFAAASACLAIARADAGELQAELQKAADHYAKQAERAEDKGSLKVPFMPKIAMGGDKKRAEKYRALSEGLKQLVALAKALQSP